MAADRQILSMNRHFTAGQFQHRRSQSASFLHQFGILTKVTVTSEQRKALKDSILNGEFANAKLLTATKNKLNRINGYLDQLTLLYDANSF